MNPVCRRGLEAALALVVRRTHFFVEIEHWLLCLVDMPDTDLARILGEYNRNAAKIRQDLEQSVARFRAGNTRNPELSPQLLTAWESAWLCCSLEHQADRIRTGHVVAAILGDRDFYARMRGSCPELTDIPVAVLRQRLGSIISGSAEDEPVRADRGSPVANRSQHRLREARSLVARMQASLDQLASLLDEP